MLGGLVKLVIAADSYNKNILVINPYVYSVFHFKDTQNLVNHKIIVKNVII